MPAAFLPCAASAAVRPFSFDSPQGLLTRIMPQFFALKVFWAYCSIALSTISSTAETRNTKLGLAPFRVIGVPAAHGPMNGSFSWFTIGTMASDTGVSRPPKSTVTFSLKSYLACLPFSDRDPFQLRSQESPGLTSLSGIRVMASPMRSIASPL